MSEERAEFAPATVALLGLGEAGTAMATGLCAAGGWRDGGPGREVLGVDVALGEGARGEAMARCMGELGCPASARYTDALSRADLVISVVTGEDAADAAAMARPLLRPGTVYADFNSITGPQTRAVAGQLTPHGIDFVDVAVMGSFLASGHRTPMLFSGPRAANLLDFAEAAGIPARVLGEGIGDASAVKILRSILMKGIEALAVECLVTARRQGLVEEVLDNMSDVDGMGFANFVRVLTITHLAHARRRMEEVEKAMQNLAETGVPALMSDATRRSHARTVEAGLDPAAVVGLDLDAALAMLDEQVVSRSP
jgi:3-hydroxyisobutyrate dehydrogenase-like beta-hydroxyacid dehydrogenase